MRFEKCFSCIVPFEMIKIPFGSSIGHNKGTVALDEPMKNARQALDIPLAVR